MGEQKKNRILWENLSPAEKKQALFYQQKQLLDQFLQTGAISQRQYDKSLGDLIEKMGISPDAVPPHHQ